MVKTLNKTPISVALIKTGLLNMPDSKAAPPLGCMYLSATLRERMGADCRILDTRLGNLSDNAVGDWIAENPPDLIGLSVLTMEAPQMHSLAQHLKKRFPLIPIVAGGPHASANLESILADKNIDWAAYLEGEYTLVELAERLSQGRSTDGILGLAHRKNGKLQVNPPRPYIINLDELPFPAWDLIDREAYFKAPRLSVIYKHAEYMPVFTSRACPFRCVYCHHIFGKKFRFRSPDNVLAELGELYHQYGIREFEIYDDCFNAYIPRSKEILRRFADSDLKDAVLSFPNGLRTDMVDQETIRLWKRARVFRVAIAVETASPRIQTLIKKNLRLPKLKAVVDQAYRQGILLHGLFMLGFPGESRAELHQTIRYAEELAVHTASFFAVNPFEGTELVDLARSMGIAINTDPQSYDFFRARFNMSQVSDAELTHLLRQANVRFYFSVKRAIMLLKIFWYNPRALLLLPRLFFDRIRTAKAEGGK